MTRARVHRAAAAVDRGEPKHDAPTRPVASQKTLSRVPREIFLAEEKAREIVARAEKKAAQIEEEAARKVETRAAAKWIADWAKPFAEAEKERARKLSIALAEEIVGAALENADALVRTRFERAVRASRIDGPLSIEAHPEDLRALERECALPKDTIRIDNDGLVRGSLLLRTRTGHIDASIRTELHALIEAVRLEVG